MVSLLVRNVDEELVALLKRKAEAHGRSAEAEHRAILDAALRGDPELDFDQLAARLRKRLEGRHHTPSEVLLRESRDER